MGSRIHNGSGRGRRGRRASCIACVWLAALIPATWAGEPYLFDDAGYLGDAVLMPDWSATLAREASQAPVLDACIADETRCPSYYRGLRRLLIRAGELTARQQLSLINHYVNRKRYQDDRTGLVETPLAPDGVKYRSRWSTVEEFVQRGGDCEDFATTKYTLLRRLGFDVDQLRVVVAWDAGERGYHAVLAVRHEGEVLLLDSDNSIRRGRNHRYRFIYSINENGIWDHEAAGDVPGAAAAPRSHQQEEETPA